MLSVCLQQILQCVCVCVCVLGQVQEAREFESRVKKLREQVLHAGRGMSSLGTIRVGPACGERDVFTWHYKGWYNFHKAASRLLLHQN